MNGQSLAFQVLNGSTELMILFMAVLAADLIADEIRSGTLTLTLVRPVSRIELLNARWRHFFCL
ncbi:ABC-2 family transporter protein [compost metagenome]